MAKVKKSNTELKRYALAGSCGRQFSFHADDQASAQYKLEEWLDYHGMLRIRSEFSVTEIPMDDHFEDLHNEYAGIRKPVPSWARQLQAA
jgi:hypothetical protein